MLGMAWLGVAYVMLILCYARLCYAMPCYATLCFVMLSYIMLRSGLFFYVVELHAMSGPLVIVGSRSSVVGCWLVVVGSHCVWQRCFF